MEAQSRILLILNYLYDRTDAEHAVSTKAIKRMLEEHGLTVPDSRTIESDIRLLIAAGHDVARSHANGQSASYRIASRDFETVELKILMDAVAASRFIGAERSRHIMARLAAMAGVRDRQALLSSLEDVDLLKRTEGGRLFTAETLYRAILARRMVRFQMTDLGVPDKRPVLHRGGRIYEVSPYAMVWNSDRYYLIAWEDSRRRLITPRVDHLCSAAVLPERIAPPPRKLDLQRYSTRRLKMYGGRVTAVTLECENRLLGKVVDAFGADFECVPVTPNRFRATVETALGPTFFGWLFQYAGRIRLVGPPKACEQYEAHFKKAATSFVTLDG